MRLRNPPKDNGNASGRDLVRNVFWLVSLLVFVSFFFVSNNKLSLSSFVPQVELVTEIEDDESQSEDTVKGSLPTGSTTRSAERKLDSPATDTDNLMQEVQQAREQADKVKAETEKLRLEVAKAKEEAAEANAETSQQDATTTQGEENTNDEAEIVPQNNVPSKEETPGAQTENEPVGDKSSSSSGKATDKPLNVIVFYPDDWGGRDLQDVNPLLKTPTFTEIAKEGIRFTHNAVTTSICWISRAALFTGQYVSSHRSTYLFRPTFTQPEKWAKTWPYLLQQAGYWVGHVGKWQYRAGPYKNQIFNFGSFFEGWTVIENKDGGRTYNAEVCREEAIKFLRERPKDKPFAATIAFYPPKGISEIKDVKPEFAAMYKDITHPEAYDRAMAYSRLPPFLQDNNTEARSRYLYRFEDHGNFQETMSAQYATLTHIDSMVGEIIKELKDQGEYENTVVIVTADNGEFHGAHALADKWYPYNEAIHVPLIIRDPRMPQKKRGTLDYSFTLNIDLAETILGAAGLEAPQEMDGRDIADLYLDNPKSEEPWRKEFFYEFPQINHKIPPSRAIVRKDWKYIDWYMNGHEELFDMKNDPFELHNVANHSEWASLKAELKHQLEVMKHDVYHPLLPDTRCDPIQPAGSDLSILPNCSQFLPDRCCPA